MRLPPSTLTPPDKVYMLSKSFTEPLGSKFLALEQSVLRFRAMQMLLVMFYAEGDVLNLNRVPKVRAGEKKLTD